MMTMNIMLYKLCENFTILQEKKAGKLKEITSVKTGFSEEDDIEKTLYVLSVEEVSTMLSANPVFAVITASDHTEESAAKYILECSSVSSGCVIAGDHEILKREVTALWQHLIFNEAELLKSMVLLHDDHMILKMAEHVLGVPFSLFWKDFRNLYSSDAIEELLDHDRRTLVPEIAYELIMDEKFHKALGYQECFYYYNKTLDRYNYCRNIFSNGVYLARMLLFLPEGNERLHPGMEELFSIISEYIASWGISQSSLFRDLMPDLIHDTLELILKDSELTEDAMNSAFMTAQWDPKDNCTLIKYRFLAGERWTIHNEMTFSFLISCLEETWPYSCGIQKGDEVIWLVNLSKSLVDVQSQVFHQQVAGFIREYVCIAGVSPVFQKPVLIPQAARAADIALRIGRKKDPHYWYYLYENYRRDYLLESMKREMPISMLISPALLLLQRIDDEQGTEYCKTLKAYLDCGYNMTTAAETIFVHRTTFFRRMERITKLTGLDFEDGETCRDLMLGFLLIE